VGRHLARRDLTPFQHHCCGAFDKGNKRGASAADRRSLEKLGDQKPQFNLEIHLPNGDKLYKVLGPHAPNLTANEVNLLHRLWLRFSDAVAPLEMHHHDVVHFALEEVQKEMEKATKISSLTGSARTSKPSSRKRHRRPDENQFLVFKL